MSYSERLEVAKKAALEAGKFLKNFSDDMGVEYKAAKDIVTAGDLASQEKIISIIKDSYSGDECMAEEKDNSRIEGDSYWVIDPIDGTVNFAKGNLLYGINIAYVDKGEIVLGVIFLPELDDLYYAEKGKGAFCNGEKLSVNSTRRLKDSVIDVGNFNCEHGREQLGNNVNFEVVRALVDETMRVRVDYCAVSTLAFIASGSVEGYVLTNCNLWDVSAGMIIVYEAGGQVTGFDGKNLKPLQEMCMVASNGKVHDELIELIRERDLHSSVMRLHQ